MIVQHWGRLPVSEPTMLNYFAFRKRFDADCAKFFQS